MNRFVYYLLFVNMIANMIASVPKILLEHRMDGVIHSMLLGIAAGLILTYVFLRFFHAFPGRDYPDLLKEYLPGWLSIPYLILLAGVWFAAGLISLITYTFMLKRFLTPDMSLLWIVTGFLILMSFGIMMQSKHILFTVENVLTFTLPVVLFLIVKAYTSPQYEWDFVRESVMHINRLPDYSAFSASSYLFAGIANLIIFNRVFSIQADRAGWKQLGIVGLAGALSLFTTYFVPIGINGFDKIDELVYPAVSTSDALRMKYGIIERVLYLFLPFFMAITFLSMLIHWHVAMEIFKNILWFKRFKRKTFNLTPYLYMAAFWLVTFKLVTYLTEHQLLVYTGFFFNILPPLAILFFCTFWYISRRAKA